VRELHRQRGARELKLRSGGDVTTLAPGAVRAPVRCGRDDAGSGQVETRRRGLRAWHELRSGALPMGAPRGGTHGRRAQAHAVRGRKV
jgi:hypothetical protein